MSLLAMSLLVIGLCPCVIMSLSVDIIDYTGIVIKDVLNGSHSSSIRNKPNQGNLFLLSVAKI
jgi:hypothetical protein